MVGQAQLQSKDDNPPSTAHPACQKYLEFRIYGDTWLFTLILRDPYRIDLDSLDRDTYRIDLDNKILIYRVPYRCMDRSGLGFRVYGVTWLFRV